MTRRQLIGFAVVLALIAAGLLARSRVTGSGHDQLAELRRAAALAPCPAGLGSGLPDLRLECLAGGPGVALRSPGPGTPMLVNLWATWCRPCVLEVPALVEFAGKSAGKVAVVGVDTEDPPSDALRFAREYGMRYPNLVDPDGKVLRANGGGPPVTLFVDAGGVVRFTHRGRLQSAPEIEKLVAEHLGVRL
jgi:thiol-disulfide isomerase/thioredoxin